MTLNRSLGPLHPYNHTFPPIVTSRAIEISSSSHATLDAILPQSPAQMARSLSPAPSPFLPQRKARSLSITLHLRSSHPCRHPRCGKLGQGTCLHCCTPPTLPCLVLLCRDAATRSSHRRKAIIPTYVAASPIPDPHLSFPFPGRSNEEKMAPPYARCLGLHRALRR